MGQFPVAYCPMCIVGIISQATKVPLPDTELERNQPIWSYVGNETYTKPCHVFNLLSVERSGECILVEVSLSNTILTRREPGEREGCDTIANKSPDKKEEEIVVTPFAVRNTGQKVMIHGLRSNFMSWVIHYGARKGSGGALQR
jgi:hypothetical protein